jgi:hypothetical protein
MGSVPEERAAFEQLATLLQSTAAANARALQGRRGTPAGRVLEEQLEHTLDRLALMYGRGTYENLSTAEIVETAVGNELLLAAALDGPASEAAVARARSLADAARPGVRLHPREPAPSVTPGRGVYVEPLRPELRQSLAQYEQPYTRWRAGAIVILGQGEVDALRAAGDEVDVLFLDPGELLDLIGRNDQQALEAELARRVAAARAAPDRVGDSRDRHVLRMLIKQSTVLRNLRDRLAAEHPAADSALLPVLAGHRMLLEARLAAGWPAAAVLADPLGDLIDSERRLQVLVSRWAAEPGDPAGIRRRFRVVADAGTRLAELERHYP